MFGEILGLGVIKFVYIVFNIKFLHTDFVLFNNRPIDNTYHNNALATATLLQYYYYSYYYYVMALWLPVSGYETQIVSWINLSTAGNSISFEK